MQQPTYIIKQYITDFFHAYFTQRDVDAVLAQCIENVHSIGTGQHEIAYNINELKQLLKNEIAESPEPLQFTFSAYHEQIIIPNEVVHADFQMKVTCNENCESPIEYRVRVSTTFMRVHQVYKVCNFHVSVASVLQEEDEFFPLQLPSQKIEDLKDLAQNDPLTKIYNRRFIVGKINKLLRINPKINAVILLIDLDHFKRINDQFGHIEGDNALISFANIVADSIRKEDLWARIGGDEFLLVIPNQDSESIQHVYQRIHDEFFNVFASYIETFNFNFSTGATFIHHQDTVFEDVYKRTDKALYEVKEQCKGKIKICN